MFRMLQVPVTAIIVFAGIESSHADESKRADDRTDRWQKLRKECEDVIRKRVAGPLSKKPEDHIQSLRSIEKLPLRFTRKRLSEALADASGSVRLTAADILTAKATSKNRQKIEKPIRDVKPADGVETVRREAIRLRLGHKDAAKTLRSWALLFPVGELQMDQRAVIPFARCLRRPNRRSTPISRCSLSRRSAASQAPSSVV